MQYAYRFYHRPASANGFTLIELSLVTLIVGIILSVAVPSFYPLLQSYHISSTLNTIERSLREARQQAVTSNQTVVMCPSDNGQSCSADNSWSSGFITFSDTDKDGQRQNNETVIYTHIATRPVTVRFNRSQPVRFNGMGRASTNGSFTVCDPRHRVSNWRITLVHSGRMRRSSTRSGCP